MKKTKSRKQLCSVAIMVFLLCLIALTFSLVAYKRRLKKMEEDYTEDNE